MNRRETYQRTLHFTGEGTYKLIEDAEAIAKRENISLNILIRNALTEFVQRHGKGNNTFPLDKYGVTWTKAVTVTKCAFKDCKKTAVGIGCRVDNNQILGFCSFHFTLCQGQKHLYKDMKWIDTIGDIPKNE